MEHRPNLLATFTLIYSAGTRPLWIPGFTLKARPRVSLVYKSNKKNRGRKRRRNLPLAVRVLIILATPLVVVFFVSGNEYAKCTRKKSALPTCSQKKLSRAAFFFLFSLVSLERRVLHSWARNREMKRFSRGTPSPTTRNKTCLASRLGDWMKVRRVCSNAREARRAVQLLNSQESAILYSFFFGTLASMQSRIKF